MTLIAQVLLLLVFAGCEVIVTFPLRLLEMKRGGLIDREGDSLDYVPLVQASAQKATIKDFEGSNGIDLHLIASGDSRYKKRNSIDISKALRAHTEEIQSQRNWFSRFLADDLVVDKELMAFIREFNAVSYFAFQNLSEQCHTIIDSCNILGITTSMALENDSINSDHSCAVTQRRQTYYQGKSAADKSVLQNYHEGNVVTFYKCICSSLQFNLAIKKEHMNNTYLEISDVDYDSIVISFKILKGVVGKQTYVNSNIDNNKYASSQISSLYQKIQVLEDIADFLARTTSHDALISTLACTEYSVTRPLDMLQRNFRRFLHMYSNYRELLQLEFPIESRRLQETKRQFNERESMKFDLHELDTERIRLEAFFFDDMASVKQNITLNRIKVETGYWLLNLQTYFDAAQSVQMVVYDFVTSLIMNPLVAMYGGLVDFVNRVIMKHFGSVGGSIIIIFIVYITYRIFLRKLINFVRNFLSSIFKKKRVYKKKIAVHLEE